MTLQLPRHESGIHSNSLRAWHGGERQIIGFKTQERFSRRLLKGHLKPIYLAAGLRWERECSASLSAVITAHGRDDKYIFIFHPMSHIITAKRPEGAVSLLAKWGTAFRLQWNTSAISQMTLPPPKAGEISLSIFFSLFPMWNHSVIHQVLLSY